MLHRGLQTISCVFCDLIFFKRYFGVVMFIPVHRFAICQQIFGHNVVFDLYYYYL